MNKGKSTLQPSDFVHLHNHTQYSLLDGLTKVPALVQFANASGMEAIAITDHGTMSGVIEFYKEAKAAGIKPIVGMEAYIAPRGHQDRDPSKDRAYYHLTLLATSHKGYQNIMRLSTIANLNGFYYKPRIDRDLLKKYSEGLIVLSGCMGGELGEVLTQDQLGKAREIITWHKDIFGDCYFLELMDHGHPRHPKFYAAQKKINDYLLELSQEFDIPAVLTSDAHYLYHEDKEAHEILLCVQTGAFLSDQDRFSLKDFDLHVSSPQDIIERWGDDHPELITNTKKVAERCDLEIELGKILIPKFAVPKGQTEKSYLHRLVWQGLAWRYGGKNQEETKDITEADAKKCLSTEIIKRAQYEMQVIDGMGFNGYFLIVSDFINWGKDRGIVFGPGRGSAAGSIVAYATKITELDPIKYDLLFERFLNPDRISMPDMDIDIQDSRRDEVIDYCVQKYGRDRVANIVTFGRMAARNAVRDVARVLEVPYADADRLAKMIPPPVQGRHIPLAKSLKDVADLKNEYKDNPTSARVFDLAIKVEGTIRSHGVHAAGVVIAPDEIVKFVPLEMAQKGVVATQYSMNPIEELGLLKMDFLGLSNLTTIKNALRIIKKVNNVDIDINNIPLDDHKVFELLKRGDTVGVFQLESAGMQRYLKSLRPTVFDDIVAMVALYRPGPMQWIDDFIARKHGQKTIEYMHAAMEPALKSTYGVIVYQEQVMQISKEMCGFTGGQADTLRKAIGKKIPEAMAKLKNDFIDGANKTVGADRKMMEKFWEQLEDFAAYCFNKSHAACYGLIAYQTAYLKAYYPEAFMAALMTSDYDNTDRLAIEINECARMGIQVLPPDVNQSFHEFAVVPGKKEIRFGLDAIKNVGHGAAEEIIRAREECGGFKTIENFFTHVNPRIVNRKSLESLAKAGAFDNFMERSKLVNNLDNVLAFAARVQKEKLSGQVDLFGNSLASEPEMTPRINWEADSEIFITANFLQWERELLGLYLSSHPLQDYKDWLADNTTPLNSLHITKNGKTVTIGGSIVAKREIMTKNGAKMAFIKLSDYYGETELIIFPNVYAKTLDVWEQDNVIQAKGKIDSKDQDGAMNGEIKILVDSAKTITADTVAAYKPKRGVSAPAEAAKNPSESRALTSQRLYIRLHQAEDQNMLLELKKLLDVYKGNTEVVLVTGASDNKQAIKLPQGISFDGEVHSKLLQTFGTANVILK